MANFQKTTTPRRDRWTPPDEPYHSITSQMTPAYDRAVADGADAELRGDAAEALRLHRSVPMFRRSTHGDRLHQLTEMGDQAPGWVINRWLTIQARRRMWTGGDPTAPNRLLQLVVPLLYPDGIQIERIGCQYAEQVLPYIYERDWAARQLDVYDLGGLRRVVDIHASPELLERADHLDGWLSAPMRACRIEYVDERHQAPLRLVDLATGEVLELLDLGARVFEGDHILARIVPVSGEPSWMFDWQPLAVSEAVATAVARARGRWLPTLHTQTVHGRLAAGDSHLPETSLVTDLPYRSWLTLVGVPLDECPDQDPSPRLAHAVKALIELMDRDPEDVLAQRHSIAELLLDPLFDDSMRWRFVSIELEQFWRQLGEMVPAYARARCDEQALWCAAAPEPDVAVGKG